MALHKIDGVVNGGEWVSVESVLKAQAVAEIAQLSQTISKMKTDIATLQASKITP